MTDSFSWIISFWNTFLHSLSQAGILHKTKPQEAKRILVSSETIYKRAHVTHDEPIGENGLMTQTLAMGGSG